MKVVALFACLLATCYAGQQQTSQQSLLCDICEFVGDEVNKRVLTDDHKKLIIFAAKAVCSKMPIFAKECNTAVDEYGKDMVDDLFKLFDVDKICAKAHLCTSSVEYPDFFQLGEGEKCRACLDGLDMVKMLISSDDMKDMLHVIVNETCMAIGGSVASCETLVDTIIDQILANLLPLFNVETICVQAGACPAPLTIKEPSEVECVVCKDVFQIMENVLDSQEVDELLNITVIQTCKLIGVGSEECKHAGAFLAGVILENLKVAAEPDYMCGMLGSCPDVPVQYLASTLKDEEGCKACMDALDLVDMILTSNDTLDLVHIAIDEICIAIGGDVAICNSIITGIVDPIIENLISIFDPASLCKQAGACPSLQNTKWEGGIFCDLCVDTILELHNIAEDKQTEEVLDELTEIVCNAIKIPFCKNIIGPLVKEALADIDNLNPNVTCTNIGACTSLIPVVLEKKEENLGDTCSECTTIANEIITLLKNDEVDSLLKAAIGEVCTILPISNCEQTLDGLLDQIIAVVKTLDGKTLCSLIGLCGSVEEVAPVTVGDTCSECTMIMDLLLKQLKGPTMQQEIEAALDEVCTILPIPNCKDTIHTYMSEIEAIINNLDGKTVCTFIDLCSSRKKESVIEEIAPKNVGGLLCSECTLISGKVLSFLQNNKVEKFIKDTVTLEVCTYLPIPDCQKTMEGYFDELSTLIKDLDEDTLCFLLGLC